MGIILWKRIQPLILIVIVILCTVAAIPAVANAQKAQIPQTLVMADDDQPCPTLSHVRIGGGEVSITPTTVRAGGTIHVTSNASGCRMSIDFVLQPGNIFVGSMPSDYHGNIDTVLTVPADIKPGRYTVEFLTIGPKEITILPAGSGGVPGAPTDVPNPRNGFPTGLLVLVGGLLLAGVGVVGVVATTRRRVGG